MREKELAKLIINVLDVKALKGCKIKSWIGFENGEGENVGNDIEDLIKKAKEILK
jgi:hypothetical protein